MSTLYAKISEKTIRIIFGTLLALRLTPEKTQFEYIVVIKTNASTQWLIKINAQIFDPFGRIFIDFALLPNFE